MRNLSDIKTDSRTPPVATVLAWLTLYACICIALAILGVGVPEKDTSGPAPAVDAPSAAVDDPVVSDDSAAGDDTGADSSAADADPFREFFHALAAVESNHNDTAVGDGGRSIGRYQIGRLYWKDSGVPGIYVDVLRPEYAEQVMLAYWRRYCRNALDSLDFETLARVHNGGPRGSSKQSTLPYWRRVQEQMRRRNRRGYRHKNRG